MRIERLAENKVKVTLTGDDLIGFNINIKKLTGDSSELHSFLFKIMETIKEETDFNPYSGQIVVEAHRVNDGMSIVISKIDSGRPQVTEKIHNGKRIIAKIHEHRTGFATYYFDKFEDICSVLEKLHNSVHEYNSLYKLNGEYCYLINFDNPALDSQAVLKNTLSVLSEFSKRSSILSLQHLHIIEHGEYIADKLQLITMADGIRKINKD